MSDAKPVVVKYDRVSPEVHEFNIGAAGLPSLTIDKRGKTGEEMSNDHYGARLLCAAVQACFTNTLANALIREGANVKGVKAESIIEKEKDSTLRTHFTVIHTDVEVELDEKDREIFVRVVDDMLAGSLVTYSLQDAIEMDINVHLKEQ